MEPAERDEARGQAYHVRQFFTDNTAHLHQFATLAEAICFAEGLRAAGWQLHNSQISLTEAPDATS